MAHHDYAEDEFDRMAVSRTVVGHREPDTNRPWWLAAIAVVLLAPVVGWAFVHFGGADSAKTVWPTDPASASASASATPGEDASATQAGGGSETGASGSGGASASSSAVASESGSASESASAEAVAGGMATEVRLLNGSSVNGLAAAKKQALAGAGFTNVVATNYTGGAAPQVSTVYYASEADAETAGQVAAQLGVSNVLLSPQSVGGGTGIVVVLRSDAAG